MGKYLIKHYGRYIYRHEDYQAICKGDDCAAQILSLFEFWTSCRIEEIRRVQSYNEQNKRNTSLLMQLPTTWLYETTEDISNGILNAYGDSSIRKSIKKLLEWGFLDSRCSKVSFDRTKEYRFNTDVIQTALDQWNEGQSLDKSDPLKTTLETVEKTQESLNLTLETVEKTQESLKVTQESLNLKDDLYSLNIQIKQSDLTVPSLSANKNTYSEEELTQQISVTPDLKGEISDKQINPHEDQGTPAAPLKNVYAQAKNVWDLIDTFLLSPELADAVIPEELTLTYNEKFKWSGWVWPWRTKKIDGVFQNFNPGVVEKIAADLARRDKATPDQKYGHAMATIGMWEKTKGGWQNLVNWCDRPQTQAQPATNDTTEAEIEIPEYFKAWSPAVHLMIYENDFRKCHSLQAFYEKRKDHKAWLVFAKREHPDWDWSLGQKPIIVF